jgi:hypothetical protein
MSLQLTEDDLGRLADQIREGGVLDAVLLGRFDQLSTLDQSLVIGTMIKALAEVVSPTKGEQGSRQLARHLMARVERTGVKFPRVDYNRVNRGRWALQLSDDAKERIRGGQSSLRTELEKARGWAPDKRGTPPPRRTEHVVAQARIRAAHEENQLRSMVNAPRGKFNRPLLDRAERIQDALVELIAIDPAIAADSLPTTRCRDFTLEHARWWLSFATSCEHRRQAETPELPPRDRRRLDATNPVLAGNPPIATAFTPATQKVFEWMSKQTEPVNTGDVAKGLHIHRATASTAVRQLCAAGLASTVGREGHSDLYRLISDEDEEEEN